MRWTGIVGISMMLVTPSGCHQPEHKGIRFTHIFDSLAGPQGELNVRWVEERVRVFHESHPQVPVELQQVMWDQIDTKSMADYRAGIPHDLLLTSPQLLAKHAVVGDLIDLKPYLEHYDELVAELAWNPVWDAGRQRGKRLAIPMGAHTRLCCYRKDFFKEVGLDPDTPPTTLDELVQTAKRLTRDIDGDGRIDIWGLGIYLGPSRATTEITFAPLIWHYGGQIWNPKTRRASFASPAGIKATRFLRDLILKHRVTPKWAVSGKYDDVIFKSLMENRSAIAWGFGSYWIQPLEAKGWIQGCFPPSIDAEMNTVGFFLTPTKDHSQFTNAWMMSVHASSPRPGLAVDLMETCLEPEALATFPDAGLPATQSTWQKPEYQTEFYQIWYQAVKTGRSMPPTAHYEELANTIAAALQEIIINEQSIPSTLASFQRTYNERYAGE